MSQASNSVMTTDSGNHPPAHPPVQYKFPAFVDKEPEADVTVGSWRGGQNPLRVADKGKYISRMIKINGKMAASKVCTDGGVSQADTRCTRCKRNNFECARLWHDPTGIFPNAKENKDKATYVCCGRCLQTGHGELCSFWDQEKKAPRAFRDDI